MRKSFYNSAAARRHEVGRCLPFHVDPGRPVTCAAWFIIDVSAHENALTLILWVLSINLAQMVLDQQRLSERSLHMKIGELVCAVLGV